MISADLNAAAAHEKRLRVGVADVFRRCDHHAPRDELRVLAAVDHPREPVERRVGGSASPHRFDERGDHVIVHVLVLVVGQRAVRHGGAHVVFGYLRGRVGRSLVDHRRGELERRVARRARRLRR